MFCELWTEECVILGIGKIMTAIQNNWNSVEFRLEFSGIFMEREISKGNFFFCIFLAGPAFMRC